MSLIEDINIDILIIIFNAVIWNLKKVNAAGAIVKLPFSNALPLLLTCRLFRDICLNHVIMPWRDIKCIAERVDFDGIHIIRTFYPVNGLMCAIDRGDTAYYRHWATIAGDQWIPYQGHNAADHHLIAAARRGYDDRIVSYKNSANPLIYAIFHKRSEIILHMIQNPCCAKVPPQILRDWWILYNQEGTTLDAKNTIGSLAMLFMQPYWIGESPFNSEW
jgi:hypothetical protein